MIRKFFHWIGGRKPDESLKVGGIFGKMTPEAMCKIDADTMNREEIRNQLARLYQRHNQAAGSLNPELREEAEHMLEAIVHCRQKYVDSAPSAV